MFVPGSYEILLVAIVALVIVGPKDLPAVLRTFFNLTRKAQSIARDFRRGLDEIAKESGIDAVKKDLQSMSKGEFMGDTAALLEDPLSDKKIGGSSQAAGAAAGSPAPSERPHSEQNSIGGATEAASAAQSQSEAKPSTDEDAPRPEKKPA